MSLSCVRFKSTNPAPGAPIESLAGRLRHDAVCHGRFDSVLALRAVAEGIALDPCGTGESNPHAEQSHPLSRTRGWHICYASIA